MLEGENPRFAVCGNLSEPPGKVGDRPDALRELQRSHAPDSRVDLPFK